LEWRPKKDKSNKPATRWIDDIRRIANNNWIRIAENRGWRKLKEMYV
jgi:hypothetical protein